MCFFVFYINFARTREGRPARRKLTELLVKSKKLSCHRSRRHLFLLFKSIFHVRLRLLSLTSSMLHLVWLRERDDKTLTPTPTGIFLMTALDWEFCATGNTTSNQYLKNVQNTTSHLAYKANLTRAFGQFIERSISNTSVLT